MGGTQSQSEDLLTDFIEIRRENNGVVLGDKKSENTYFLKEFSYANKRQFEMEFKRLQGVQAQPQNQNILGLVRLFSQTFNNICSNSYKIYALYEYPSITLNQQIEARRKENKYFDECELWSIVQSCANALSELKPTLSLHPKSIYIVPDGVLKVINNQMIDDQYRCIVKDNDVVYYAPEKVRDFKKNDNENGLRKQGIFSLGMTILHASLLTPVQDCYNFQSSEFYEDKLEKHIENLVNFKPVQHEEDSQENAKTGRYSEQFIQMLAMILEPNPNKRASLMEVHGMLNKVWNTEADQENGKEEQNQENDASETQRKDPTNMSLKQSKNFDEKSRDMNSSSFLLKETSKTNNDRSQKKQLIDTQNRNPKAENRSYVTSYHQSERQSRPNLTELAARGFAKPTTDSIPYTQPYVPPVYTVPSPYIPAYNYDQQGFRIGGASTLPSMSLMSSVQSYPIPSATNMGSVSNKENSNLYTDPKLLQMIKKDLQDINQLKKSSIMNMGSYGGVYSTGYVNPYVGSSSFSDIGAGMFSSKSSLGLGLQNPNIQQIYTVNTQANYTHHRIDVSSKTEQIRSQTSLGKPDVVTNFSKQKLQLDSLSTVAPASTTSVEQPQYQGQQASTIAPPVSNSNPAGATNPKTVGNPSDSAVFIVEQFEDGRKFQGFLVQGIKNGHGKLTYADGAYYQGQFKNDKMQGQGTLFYGPDRPAYEGEWKQDQFHGFGTLHNESPLQLNGNFNYNDFNLIEDFWVCYEGNFDSDNKSGEGKLILSNGEEFHGEFENDCINGKGVFLCNDGQQITGVWEDNILVQLDA